MASQALASLTATYTDSEGEEDMEDGQESPDKHRAEVPPVTKSLPSPIDPAPAVVNIASAPSSPKKLKRLVSYHDDTALSEDEPVPAGSEDDMRRISMEEDTDENGTPPPLENVSEDGVIIPPEPPGKCPGDLQEKISVFYNRMAVEGLDMNKSIQDRKSFRNPSIYEKLIDFCGISELDTNYPPEIYDPLRWGKESYFEELAKVQKQEMDRREKDRKEKLAKIDFTTGTVKKMDKDEDPNKRKSKWDQMAPNSSSVKASVKPAGIIQASLTANVTGTKSTVISAFGSLPKKK